MAHFLKKYGKLGFNTAKVMPKLTVNYGKNCDIDQSKLNIFSKLDRVQLVKANEKDTFCSSSPIYLGSLNDVDNRFTLELHAQTKLQEDTNQSHLTIEPIQVLISFI